MAVVLVRKSRSNAALRHKRWSGQCGRHFRRGCDRSLHSLLSEPAPRHVTVVERTEVAAAASGKAGGFLALDWCAGTPLNALARRSFELHAALAHEIGNDWGRRGMTAYSGLISQIPTRAVEGRPN